MGFYQPAQLVIDARKHGVEVRPIDINYSYWDNTLEEKSGKYNAMRLGFRQIKGLRREEMSILTESRLKPYTSIHELMDVGVSLSSLERLADADAFRSIDLDRRQALWEVSALADRPTGIYQGQASESETETGINLPYMSLSEHVVHDYGTTSLSLKAHPVSFVREKLTSLGIVKAKDLLNIADGAMVKISGLVLVRQRPGTAAGVCFITIEDETGCANLVVFKSLFDKYRKEILRATFLMVEGKLQREGEVTHVIAQRCYNMSQMLRTLGEAEDTNLQTLSRADEREESNPDERVRKANKNTVQTELFSSSRDFR